MKKLPNKKIIEQHQDRCDVLIIGAGAAGMRAAIEASRLNQSVLVIEKNHVAGKKLAITGGGRCNITNDRPQVRDLVSAYKEAGKFLFSAFVQHDVTATREWFAQLGIDTIIEGEGRVFPISQKATDVRDALVSEIKRLKIPIKYSEVARDITKSGNEFKVTLQKGQVLIANKVIVATGGLSRPETGSTGDALPWLQKLGHTIIEPRESLVPVRVAESLITARLGGISISDCGISLWVNNKLQTKSVGKVLFTHFGLSGPGILNLSKNIGDAMSESSTVTLALDILPQYISEDLESLILKRLMDQPNKLLRNQFGQLIQGALVIPILTRADIPLDVVSHSVTVEMRRRLILQLKAFTFTPVGLLSSDKAIVSSGGVDLTEIDFRTMESRLVPGLYLVGDVLNIDRPSGGYSLQLCWTAGMVAGQSVAKSSDKSAHKAKPQSR